MGFLKQHGPRFTLLLSLVLNQASARAETAPIQITREVYVEQAVEGQTRWTNAYYVGPDLSREEVHSFMAQSDTPEAPQRRRSKDNGATWTPLEEMDAPVFYEQGARIFWGMYPLLYDKASQRLVSIWLRQTKLPDDKQYYNHCLCAGFSRCRKKLGQAGPPAL